MTAATEASKLAKDAEGLEVLATGKPVPSSGNKHFFLCSFSWNTIIVLISSFEKYHYFFLNTTILIGIGPDEISFFNLYFKN